MRILLTFNKLLYILLYMDRKTIKELRVKLGLTQEQLAQKLGVTFVTVNRWENGKTKPSALAIKALKDLESEVMA